MQLQGAQDVWDVWDMHSSSLYSPPDALHHVRGCRVHSRVLRGAVWVRVSLRVRVNQTSASVLWGGSARLVLGEG